MSENLLHLSNKEKLGSLVILRECLILKVSYQQLTKQLLKLKKIWLLSY